MSLLHNFFFPPRCYLYNGINSSLFLWGSGELLNVIFKKKPFGARTQSRVGTLIWLHAKSQQKSSHGAGQKHSHKKVS